MIWITWFSFIMLLKSFHFIAKVRLKRPTLSAIPSVLFLSLLLATVIAVTHFIVTVFDTAPVSSKIVANMDLCLLGIQILWAIVDTIRSKCHFQNLFCAIC